MSARPIYVTRKFPPHHGGMETIAAETWSILRERPGAVLIANRSGNRWLPLWAVVAPLRLVGAVVRARPSVVLAGDAVAFVLVGWIGRLLRVPVVAVVHGLDITWRPAWYQWVIRRVLPRADRIIANSAATAAVAAARGVPADRVSVVALGLHVDHPTAAQRVAARTALLRDLGLDAGCFVMVSVGRLVERKGLRWFVADVMTRLPDRCVLIVAGSGPEAGEVARSVAAAGLAARVRMLGAVDDHRRDTLMAGADVLVQPNLLTPGDMEGFGLVTIEAALRGTPAVAADLEGLQDAVLDGQTGSLVAPGDADAWATVLERAAARSPEPADVTDARARRARRRFGRTAYRTRLLNVLDVAAGEGGGVRTDEFAETLENRCRESNMPSAPDS